MEGFGGTIKKLLTFNKSELNIPEQMKDFVKLGPLDKESAKTQSTKSLERGLLAADSFRNFREDSFRRKKKRVRSLPDASNLKGLTDDLDDAMAELLKISGTGWTM